MLDGVSARVAPGEVLAVAGPNGAGKSTLLRVLAGLLPPVTGRVALDGVALPALDRRALGREIAYLPQERVVHWPVTVSTVVGLGRLPHRTAAAAASEADRLSVAAAMRPWMCCGLPIARLLNCQAVSARGCSWRGHWRKARAI